MNWNAIPDKAVIDRTMAALKARNFNPLYAADKESAFSKLKELIPSGADVMTGSSTTLIEIGFIDYLVGGKHLWKNWKDRIVPEKDPVKQDELRRQSTTAGYFLGSVQAIAETGHVVAADASGSRQGGYIYGGKKVIWVTGVNKIVPTLEMALRRLKEHVVPLEDARMKSAGFAGTFLGKVVVYEKEFLPDRITTILIGEKLGF